MGATPCLQCGACRSIEEGRYVDLIEIDGASKTRVEDTRELLDNIQYAPSVGRYKIYLIDEVHMLSNHSFNALLKTLEEPPAHVKFLLATTDPHKLPVTVLSRCLQFYLKPLTEADIIQQLQLILNKESISFEAVALETIALAAKGSLRDALSLLDQGIALCDKHVNNKDIKAMLGHTQENYALDIIHALNSQAFDALMGISHSIAKEGGNYPYALEELIKCLHQISMAHYIAKDSPLCSFNDTVYSLKQEISPEEVQLFYQIAVKGLEELHLAPTLRIGFEMVLLRMSAFLPINETPRPTLVADTPQKTDTTVSVPTEPSPVQTQQHCADENLTEPQKPSDANIQDWPTVISQCQLSGLALNALEHAQFLKKEGSRIYLAVSSGHSSLFTRATVVKIQTALSEVYQCPIKLELNQETKVTQTPAKQKVAAQNKAKSEARAALENDPFFQKVKETFSGELVEDSIGLSTEDNL